MQTLSDSRLMVYSFGTRPAASCHCCGLRRLGDERSQLLVGGIPSGDGRWRPGFATEAVQTAARVNVTCVTPLGEEVASTS